jgi:hypothetical protein
LKEKRSEVERLAATVEVLNKCVTELNDTAKTDSSDS